MNKELIGTSFCAKLFLETRNLVSWIKNRVRERLSRAAVKPRWERLLWLALGLIVFSPGNLWLYLILFTAVFMKLHPLPAVGWVWLGLSFLSTLLAPEPDFLHFSLESVIILAGLCAGQYFKNDRTCWRILIISGLPTVFLGVLQTAIVTPYPRIWVSPEQSGMIPVRITGVLGNPNLFGVYLAFFIPLLLTGIEKGKIREEILTWISLLLYCTTLILTFSRTGWAAAVAGTVFLWYRRKKDYLVRAALLLVLVIFLFPPVQARLFTGDKMPGRDGAFAYRLGVWESTGRLIKRYPLWGVGSGGFPREYPRFGRLPADHAHNLYLQVAAEKGIAGLILLGWIIYLLLTLPAGDGIKRGVKAALISQLTAGLAEAVWVNPLPLFLFWFGFGYLYKE